MLTCKLLNTNYRISIDADILSVPTNNDYYLYKSTNTYHLLVNFMGNLTKDQLSNQKNKWRVPFDTKNETFPRYRDSGLDFCLVYDPYFMKFDNKASLMSNGLNVMYKLDVGVDNHKPLKLSKYEKDNNASIWIKPSPSEFLMSDKGGVDGVHSALSQVTTGAYPIKTNPVKMAEMYGVLFGGNRNFKLQIVKDDNQKSMIEEVPIDKSSSWDKASWNNFIQKDVYLPLGQTLTVGTASDFNGARNTLKFQNDGPEYYLYSKTGTSGDAGKVDNEHVRIKHFALIISKTKLEEGDLEENYKKNKFIIIYFSNHFVSKSQIMPKKMEMVKEIMKSPYVLKYFGN